MAQPTYRREVADDSESLGPLLLEQFRRQWDEALSRLAPPDVESFLHQAGADTGSELFEMLRAVDSEYRRRLLHDQKTGSAGSDETVVRPLALLDDIIGRQPPGNGSGVASPADGMPSGTITMPPEPEPAETEPPPPGSSDPFTPTVLHAAGEPQPDQSDGADGTPKAAPRVAGYEVLGVLGRGGMGVVYRARQTGLNRIVALKMILGGGHADPEQLARFRAEAEAVAQLQHPQIVQIYEIGTHDGLPFFSLEFVEGGSLEQERAGRPMPPLRAAELVEQLAGAMQSAHARGIVHRDLKPANVLLTRDGVPKVTDFGLVKRVEEDDSGQTRTGTIMGTPSYMAPEQAWDSKAVGPLADVYSLGAILYALLTGRPPFLGPTPVETVMLLRSQEPVPPSRLQPALPRDLETICLKCLQKEPEKRYAGAAELAEDLRRFRGGEPILARPVGRVERVWRWCRRNRALATAAGVAAVLALSLMIGGPLAAVMIGQERTEAVAAQQLAEKNERKAARNAEAAREQRDLAVVALNTLVERVPTELRNVPGTAKIKRDLLLTAMDGLNKVGAAGDQSKDAVMARAHAKMGEVLLEAGDAAAADTQFRRSHAILRNLAETDAATPRHVHQLRLGRSYRNLGKAAERLHGAQAAREFFRQSLAARQAALPLAPDPLFVKQELAESYGLLGQTALTLGQPREAMDHFLKGVAYRDEWLRHSPENDAALREQAGARLALGHGHLNLGDPAQAVEHYRAALAILSRLAGKGSPGITDRANVALCHDYLGTARLLAGEAAAARDDYRQAVERLEPLCREAPRSAILRRKLAKACYGLGVACAQLDDPEAKTYLERSLALRQDLAKKAPEDVSLRQDVMLSLARLGRTDDAARLAEPLAAPMLKEPEVLYTIACVYALCAAGTMGDASTAYQDKAVAALRQCIASGYEGTAMLQLDPDLSAIQNHEEFRRLIAELQQRQASPAKPSP